MGMSLVQFEKLITWYITLLIWLGFVAIDFTVLLIYKINETDKTVVIFVMEDMTEVSWI